jgi:hypothetical protein
VLPDEAAVPVAAMMQQGIAVIRATMEHGAT